MTLLKEEQKNLLLQGTVFFLLCSLLNGIIFFSYAFGAGDNSFMTPLSWLYLFSSSFLHAGLLTFVPFILVFFPLSFINNKSARRLDRTLLFVIYVFLTLLFIINRYVFQIYHFHINGFVFNMVFSTGAQEVFVFDAALYLKAVLIFVLTLVVIAFLFFVSLRNPFKNLLRGGQDKNTKKFYLLPVCSFFVLMLLSQGIHIYGAAKMKTSVLEADNYLPYYFPLSMNSALDSLGLIDKENITSVDFSEKESKLNYPANKLNRVQKENYPNIVIIAIDSWNFRTLTEECMPNLWEFKQESEYFANHLSSSNGTRGGIFGLFTGLSSYYWKSFEYSSLRPVFIEELLRDNYRIQIYPSATFQNPPFDRMFFKRIEGINFSTPGKTPYERDCRITEDFIADLSEYKKSPQTFFSFIFYDLAHAITLPKEKLSRFKPTWKFPDYFKLKNDTDPQPFFNLYRNCVYQIDSLIGLVLKNLKEQNMLENTVVLITGDHGQEFNENHKNYWGHSGNYSKYQIQVPLILHSPLRESKVYTHRTTHYDIVPTLLKMFLGVENPASDYSMGKLLFDKDRNNWHIVGNDLNYAFITDDFHIIEKAGNGYVKVYDSNLNIDSKYKLSPKEINDNLLFLNKFFR